MQCNVAPTDASDGKIDITIQLALFGIITMVRYIVLDKLITITMFLIGKCQI